jgi:hypothetical protein
MRMRRRGAAILLLAICVVLGGCRALRADTVIAPEAARAAVQSQLGVELYVAPTVASVAALTDVDATYAATTASERILVVVFDSREATVQLTGSARPDGELVVARNVVATYDHDRGTTDRIGVLRRALRELDAQTPDQRD